jgi:ABC-type nitrate/sulfonate/bicarbonate transport system ATPase subunit
MTASLSARGLGHSFADVTALDGFDIEVGSGKTVAVVGPSGCGKSTLLELICGLRNPDSGSIVVGGEAAAAARMAHCAYMPQKDCLLPWYSAIDNASLALRNKGASKAEARRQAGDLFARFGLEGFEQSRPEELSGGMRQRVAFLRTFLSGKEVLLLDEPFAALDAITRAELQEWLLPTLTDGSRTVVLVSHDVEEALYLADSVLVMSARPGRVLERIESPRDPALSRSSQVTAPEFTSLRERILERLAAPASAPIAADNAEREAEVEPEAEVERDTYVTDTDRGPQR